MPNYGNLPLSFEPNVGQADSRVQFISHTGGHTLLLTGQEAVLVMNAPESNAANRFRRERGLGIAPSRSTRPESSPSVLHMSFEGAASASRIVGERLLPGKLNYFVGNDPNKWRTGVPTYAAVEYKKIYPGIDLLFYGNGRALEYDLNVQPGADPGVIALHFAGNSSLKTDSAGNLLVRLTPGEIELRRPVVYQRSGHDRDEIPAGYVVASDHDVRIALGAYDHSRPLVVDPAVIFSTYLGGDSDDWAAGIAVDSNGDVFVAGQTTSANFPTTPNSINPGPPSSSGESIFVTEMDPTGTSVLYSTYIGGNGGEVGLELAIDGASPPNAYVTGYTFSSNFPTTPNAYLPVFTPGAGGTAFVTKFNPALNGTNALLYSTYLGGNGSEYGNDIVVDPTGNIYVTGATTSTNFPVTPGAFQSAKSGGGSRPNAFVSRIDPGKSGSASLVYSTYLGGTGNAANSYGDYGIAIAADSQGNAFVSGFTGSVDFATTAGGFMQTTPGPAPGFVSRLDTTKSGAASLIYSSFLGGSSTYGDEISDLTLSQNDLAYVTGYTCSADFPVTLGAFRTVPPSTVSTLCTGLFSIVDTSQAGASSLVYSTFLGGSGGDQAIAVAVDPPGNAYIAGETYSADFPTTPGAFQTALQGTCGDGFVSELTPLGNGPADLVYSTFYSGSGSSPCAFGDFAFNIALDSAENAYLTGGTQSPDFPVVPSGAFQTSLRGPSDAFIAKLTLTPKVLPELSISSLSISSGGTGSLAMISGSNFGMSPGESTVTFGKLAATITSWSPASIIVQVPSTGTPGSLPVSVHTSIGTSNSLPFTVLPTIAGVSPSSGSGGESVTINGYNFGSSGSVTFNGVKARTKTWNSGAIIATVPHRATTGSLVVTSDSLSSPAVPFAIERHRKDRGHQQSKDSSRLRLNGGE